MRRREILYYNPALRIKAKNLRRDMTLGEVTLWNEIKQRKLGFDFDRQRPISQFIVDFYCKELKLAIEIDGDSHSSEASRKRDAERQRKLGHLGIYLIRFDDLVVRNQVDKVIEELILCIADLYAEIKKTTNAKTR